MAALRPRYHPNMANVTINITGNIAAALNSLKRFDGSQVRYAAVRTANELALEVQTSLRASMPSSFTLRRTWVQKGIRVQFANKTNLTAIVGSVDKFMGIQETGGNKTGKAGGGDFSASSLPGRGASQGRVAVPLEAVLRTKRGEVKKADKPQGLGIKAFVIKSRDGRDFLARRFAKGKRAGLQFLYALKRTTKIKPRLGLQEIAQKVIERRAQQIFLKNLAAASADSKNPQVFRR